MANFQTHVCVATGVSMLMGALLYGAHMASSNMALSLIAMGSLGGIMPDIDAGQSVASKIVFQLLGGIIAFIAMFALIQHIGILLAVGLWALIYVGFRYGVFHLFKSATVHRGMIHSLPIAFLFSFSVVIVSSHFLGLSDVESWLMGTFFLVGFLVHLILDELYSVDLAGATLKSSFGSAMTLFSFKEPLAYMALYTIAIGFFFLTPPLQPVVDYLFSPTSLLVMKQHLFYPSKVI